MLHNTARSPGDLLGYHREPEEAFMSEAARLFTDGEMYERLMGRWSRIVAEVFLEWIKAPKSVGWLDVGCGNGAFTEEVIARCAPAAVAAVDPSTIRLCADTFGCEHGGFPHRRRAEFAFCR